MLIPDSNALLYGIIFLMLSTFPTLWTIRYGESVGIGSLNYISIAVGMTIGGQTGGRMLDILYRHLKSAAPNAKGRPEFRVPLLFFANFLDAGGLFMYGWSAQATVHWIVPNIGAAIFSAGATITLTGLQTYMIDAYTVYAASAIGTRTMARALTGFSFPLFAPFMYSSLGWGWGNSVLGFATLGIGLSGALVLWFYGQTLREASPYAANPEKQPT